MCGILKTIAMPHLTPGTEPDHNCLPGFPAGPLPSPPKQPTEVDLFLKKMENRAKLNDLLGPDLEAVKSYIFEAQTLKQIIPDEELKVATSIRQALESAFPNSSQIIEHFTQGKPHYVDLKVPAGTLHIELTPIFHGSEKSEGYFGHLKHVALKCQFFPNRDVGTIPGPVFYDYFRA